MEVVPLSVGRVSRSWDEQALDVSAAAGQLGAAPTGGFTNAVEGVAARFTSAWERHTTGLAGEAESCADRLRAVMADYMSTDQGVGADLLRLTGYLWEQR
ncbi:MAG TPA: hypothetical protein VFI99_03115 [Nocardioides sp.]|jgi:hypothetical protein|nr:hypothetical protein [Nocardioides sp.]